MKVFIIYLILVSSFILLLTGCGCSKPLPPEIIIQKEVVYLNKPIPLVQDAPIGLDYKMSYIKYNDNVYYQMTLEDGEILKLNWDRYKSWATTNYKILKDLNKKD